IGIFTSLLTAIYMFRVVFLTFHGQRGPAAEAPAHPEEEGHASHRSTRTHHHAPGVHDAPPAMAFALIVLAIGSVVAGYVGLSGRFETFLEPSFARPPEAAAPTLPE